MTTLLFRTVLIYLLLMIAMRLMGKRQIGQLDITDLITTLLISEIAALPITDNNIPITHAVIPIFTLLFFEVTSSLLISRFPRIKSLITPRPATLIREGKLCPRAMMKARISTDELIGELRQKDITDIEEVLYAILEQNGKITVIPKAKYRTPTLLQLDMEVKEPGLFRVVIDKGTLNRHSMEELNLSEDQLSRILKKEKLTVKDVYLMMMNDAGETEIMRKDEVK